MCNTFESVYTKLTLSGLEPIGEWSHIRLGGTQYGKGRPAAASGYVLDQAL